MGLGKDMKKIGNVKKGNSGAEKVAAKPIVTKMNGNSITVIVTTINSCFLYFLRARKVPNSSTEKLIFCQKSTKISIAPSVISNCTPTLKSFHVSETLWSRKATAIPVRASIGYCQIYDIKIENYNVYEQNASDSSYTFLKLLTVVKAKTIFGQVSLHESSPQFSATLRYASMTNETPVY